MTTFQKMKKLHVLLVLLIVLFSEFTPVFPATASEKDILLLFKGNISDDPLNVLSSWSPGNDPCLNYSGITCDSNQNVSKIVLWNTRLSGVLSPALSGLMSLRSLTLFGNRFSGNVPQDYGNIKSLWKLNLSSNALSGSIPDFIGQLKNLRFLDLSKNEFSGEISPSLFASCGKMRFISLADNNLTGSIPDSLVNCSSLVGFDVSNNALSGDIPPRICDLPNLAFLSLRRNVMAGSVERNLSDCNSLEFLDLSSNLFVGNAPFDRFGLVNMTYFNVSHNGFQGQIPEITTCSQRMKFFDASTNNLDGVIPPGITRCTNLRVLDLENNRLTGSIPITIGILKSLSIIKLGNNLISGTIPAEIGDIELLQALNLHNLKLQGQIPSQVTRCQFLLELDVSGNALDGEIPQALYNSTYLSFLDLHRNHFSGSIPSSIGSLLGLQYLDLSENALSGSIPLSVGNLGKLTNFNVSYNLLSGEIPQSSNITNFGITAFFHNPGLCGHPLGKCSGMMSKKKALTVSAVVAIIAAALILIGVCIITILNKRARKKREKAEIVVTESTPLASSDSNVIIGKLVLFSKSLPSKYEDWETGTKALLDKERLVGGGSLGAVYRTSFEGGISIAVKKLETLGRIKSQDEFEQEIGRLGNLQHPNLVSFQGYYWSSTMQLILSEFIQNGNLYENLHGLNFAASTSTNSGITQLSWEKRFLIAISMARALAYLHHDCKPAILHLNIKSTNILLDENFEPKLSDYGLAKLLPMFDNYGMTKYHNAVGYIAPELAESSRTSDKCDVYSFGVVLLELVTGRKPVESPSSSEVVVLCDYVRKKLERGSASDCFDRRLRKFSENELIQVMKLGLFCTSQDASKRPSMAEVVQFLESIRNHST